MAESWEALERTASRALEAVGEDRGSPEVPLRRWPRAVDLFAGARALASVDPGPAVLLAETAVWMRLRGPLERYEAAGERARVRLRPTEPGVPWRLVPAAIAGEDGRARRELLWQGADALATTLRPEAVEVVDELRACAAELLPVHTDAVGLGDEAIRSGFVLDATDDAFAELDAWAARQLEMDRSRATWSDRLRLLVAPAVLREVPPATWGDLATGWLPRVGLEGALGRVRDRHAPAETLALGVDPWPGDPSVLRGRPRRLGFDAGEMFGALGACVAAAVGPSVSPGARRGVHRALDGAAHALVRSFLVDRTFLSRDAGLGGVARERAGRAALHAELLRLRWDAAMARWLPSALRREAGVSERFVAETTRAWGAAPSPAWAVHLAALAFEPGGAWPGRSAARVRGALHALALRETLRERFDEDWFRNPRTGAAVRGAWDALRALGPTATGDAATEDAALVRWLRDSVDGLR